MIKPSRNPFITRSDHQKTWRLNVSSHADRGWMPSADLPRARAFRPNCAPHPSRTVPASCGIPAKPVQKGRQTWPSLLCLTARSASDDSGISKSHKASETPPGLCRSGQENGLRRRNKPAIGKENLLLLYLDDKMLVQHLSVSRRTTGFHEQGASGLASKFCLFAAPGHSW